MSSTVFSNSPRICSRIEVLPTFYNRQNTHRALGREPMANVHFTVAAALLVTIYFADDCSMIIDCFIWNSHRISELLALSCICLHYTALLRVAFEGGPAGAGLEPTVPTSTVEPTMGKICRCALESVALDKSVC